MSEGREPESVVGRLGWWSFETTTPLTEGTYAAACSSVAVISGCLARIFTIGSVNISSNVTSVWPVLASGTYAASRHIPSTRSTAICASWNGRTGLPSRSTRRASPPRCSQVSQRPKVRSMPPANEIESSITTTF